MSAHTNVNNLSFTYANHLKYIQKVQKYKMQAKFDLKKKQTYPPPQKLNGCPPTFLENICFAVWRCPSSSLVYTVLLFYLSMVIV